MRLALAAPVLRGTFATSRGRVALTIACIALGVALAGAVQSVHTSALAEIDRAARVLSGKADLEIRGPRSGFDERVFLDVAARDDVAVASPVVEVDAALAGREGTVRVMGIDAFRASRLQPAFVTSGAATGAGEMGHLLARDAAWVSPSLAARLGVDRGGTVAVRAGSATPAFQVSGVLAGLDDAGEVLVTDIATAQESFGRVGSLSRIELRLLPGTDLAAARRSLAASLPPGVVVTPANATAGRAEAVSRAYRVNLDALAWVALATGAFLVFSTLALQAARRRQEFALLRALGLTRGEVAALLALEAATLGAIGALLGTALGLAGSHAILLRTGADLGAGFFGGGEARLQPSIPGLALIALGAIAMSVAGALQVARAVGRLDVAEALRDRGIDLPQAGGNARLAVLLAAAGVPFLFIGPIAGLPLGGYAAIALWLAAAVAAVGPLCRALLAHIGLPQRPAAALALAQVRHLPGHLAASVAGIVVSASLCIAMAIMVHSFRDSVEDWLRGVVRGDLYVGTPDGGNTVSFSVQDQQRVAALPGVAHVDALDFDRLVLDPSGPPVTLVARPIDARVLEGFQAVPRGMPPDDGTLSVWVSEAARDLHGWKTGDTVTLPIGGRAVPVHVRGVIRDFARTWGAVMMPVESYRRLTGRTEATELVVFLAPGADTRAVQSAVRDGLPHASALVIEDAGSLRQRSLAIFDRSFAITYALEAIAIAIGLAGVTSSFAALAWSRRREFGVLRFMGFTRGEVLRMLGLEGAAIGALGALLGFASGAAISGVLVHVVNRQSFHWSLEIHWPWLPLAALVAALVAACAIGARVSGAAAVRHEAVLAVKDDA